MLEATELTRRWASGKIQKFWSNRSANMIHVWIAIHVVIRLIIEVMGFIPGLSHSWDLATFLVLDEVIQFWLVGPAVRELMRRDVAQKIAQNESQDA